MMFWDLIRSVFKPVETALLMTPRKELVARPVHVDARASAQSSLFKRLE